VDEKRIELEIAAHYAHQIEEAARETPPAPRLGPVSAPREPRLGKVLSGLACAACLAACAAASLKFAPRGELARRVDTAIADGSIDEMGERLSRGAELVWLEASRYKN
jgi:ferric-dicitrate binding protein FerR (iron transport regulator)